MTDTKPAMQAMGDDELARLASELKIPRVASRFIELSKSGMLDCGEMSSRELLADLLQSELAERKSRRLARTVKSLGLSYPWAAIDKAYGPGFRSGISRQRLAELSSCDWIRCRRSLLLMGPAGCGKTWIADLLILSAAGAGMRIWCSRMPEFIAQANIEVGENRLAEWIAAIGRHDLVCLDDFGQGVLTPEAESALVELASCCAGRTSSLLITTQMKPEGLAGSYFLHAFRWESFIDRIAGSDRGRWCVEISGKPLRPLPESEPQCAARGAGNGVEVPAGKSNASNTQPEPPAGDGSTAAAAPKRRHGRPPKHMVQPEPEPSANGSGGTISTAGAGKAPKARATRAGGFHWRDGEAPSNGSGPKCPEPPQSLARQGIQAGTNFGTMNHGPKDGSGGPEPMEP